LWTRRAEKVLLEGAAVVAVLVALVALADKATQVPEAMMRGGMVRGEETEVVVARVATEAAAVAVGTVKMVGMLPLAQPEETLSSLPPMRGC
jgi:hypothetical protein